MKRVLITGSNSYIGNKLTEWLENFPGEYSIDSISLRNDSWKDKDFAEYDVIVHMAGIAHIKETKENADLYYKVNCDLTYEVAHKAKLEGVNQFIFLSSMSVYGMDFGVINENSELNPKTNYGKSKLKAERLILPLADNSFKIAILRPPMIYGEGCRGNYPKLASLSLKTPFFPDIVNKRSMIFINNLTEFIRRIIEIDASGVFFPQNKEYVGTTELVKLIASVHGKKIRIIRGFKWITLIGFKFSSNFRKVFGTLIYDKELLGGPGTLVDGQELNFDEITFEESIKYSEGRGEL